MVASKKGYYKVCRKCGSEGYEPYTTKLAFPFPEQSTKLVTNFLKSAGSLPKRLNVA